MKKLLYFILGLIVALIIAYFVVLNLPKASSKNKDTVFKMEAASLYNEFVATEKNANRKYIGKIIEVSGTVSEIEKDKQGATVVYLSTGDSFYSILCTLEKGTKSIPKINEKTTIKGHCTGYLQDVVLNKCIVIN